MTTDQARSVLVQHANLRLWGLVAVLAAAIGMWAWQQAGMYPVGADAPAALRGFGWAFFTVAWLSGGTFLGLSLMRWRAGRLLERADV